MKTLLFTLLFVPFFAVSAADISGYELPELTVTPLGSGTLLKVGRVSEIGRFRIQNSSRKKMVLESLTLRNYGKAKLDMALENSGVYVGNQLVSNGAFVDRKNITFLFGSAVSEGFTIPAASSVIFSLQSMIAYARPGDDIELGLRYAEDFVIREMSSGFQTSITEKFRLENYPLHPGNLNVLRRWYRYRR